MEENLHLGRKKQCQRRENLLQRLLNHNDDDFGQKLPPLHIYLKRVLDKYPEGGQILKELVQNADDAGARRVDIVYDKTQHSTATMWSESLQDFNGPCLYVYNDATFQEVDWKNIQHPEQSGKLDDPTKVGRFGLGFISVYHLTDLPSIISGQQIGFLDPHEKYFAFDPHTRITHKGKRGKKWHLSADIVDQFPDQFTPFFSPMFNCSRDSFENGWFDGTIFRFPLRNTTMKSQVSNVVYDDDRIYSLFQSYQADAEISLLFLKNVEKVALHEKTSADESSHLLFSVEVSETDRLKLRSERKKLIESVVLSKNVTSCCIMKILQQVSDNQRGLVSSSNKYLTVNMLKKKGISKDLQNLVVDQDLKLLPWVGVSMRVGDATTDQISGRVFCFLPLPESERTDLPIHIHGYFGLGDNRRSIKWPDRESEHDKAARWNQLLVHEVFPGAFVTLIEEAIAQGFLADDVYRAWPNVTILKDEWKVGVRKFLCILKEKAVMYTALRGHVWQKPSNVFIDPEKDYLLHRLLKKKLVPVAVAPDHVIAALKWGGVQTKIVTPAIVRKNIKSDLLEWMTSKEKLHLLTYILKDKNFQDLDKIWLLPLEDGTFTDFSTTNATVYVSTGDIPSALFPNMSKRFAAKEMPGTLKEAEQYTQLKCLTLQMVPALLKDALPRKWVQGSSMVKWTPGVDQQPQKDWLEKTWTWLQHHCSSVSLRSFTSIPLVQYDVSNGCHYLAKFSCNLLIYQQKQANRWNASNSQLPETMCAYLKELGVIVIRSGMLPMFIQNHRDVDTFIRPPDTDGVTAVLEAAGTQNAIHHIAKSENDLKQDIRHFFNQTTLSDKCKKLLRKFPIFTTIDNKYVSVSQVNASLPSGLYEIPVTRLERKFLCEQEESDSLAINLGAYRISQSDLLRSYILPNIDSRRQYYTTDECLKIMRWVLERPEFDDAVQQLSFVPTENGQKCPTELFTPDNVHLKTLFKGKPLFPVAEYAEGKLLHYLKRVGLRGITSVTAQELLDIAVQLSDSHDHSIATAFLEHITDHSKVLDQTVNRNRIQKSLGKFLQDRAWVPFETVRPISYPDSIKWYGDSCIGLCCPEESELINKADLLGSVKPLVKVRQVTSEFSSFFSWGALNPNKYSTVEMVAKHLKNVAASYENVGSIQNVTQIIEAIYTFLNQAQTRHIQTIFNKNNCVLLWHGSGFTTPNKMAFSIGTLKVNLAPYLHILPTHLHQYSKFLKAVGVKERFNDDVLNNVLRIIQEKHQQTKVSPAEQEMDLKLVCDILNSILVFASTDSCFSDVLVPCRKQKEDSVNTLNMATSSKCLYVDEERLLEEYKRSGCTQHVVHEMVPNMTAKRLGLRPLSHFVAPVDNVDLGYDIEGPHQSTVNAIRHNLDIYKEGLDVFKEIIQNADDAGASEVKFLIDWRDNSQTANSLLSDKMKMCHGPALWAYNNATFTEEDVKNICSIAAASKKHQLDKVGRFGLGFTSVYHITDVPSVVSGPFILIFDPRTNHLGNRITPGRPGIKLDIRNKSHQATLRSYPDQFKPFQGIFNCDLSTSTTGFENTLFRLPLRTEQEVADMSQDYLSKAVYNSQDEMSKMMIALKESAPSLLLFTQNVLKVSVYSLSANCANSDQYKELLNVSVECKDILPRCITNQQNFSAQRKILKATHERMLNDHLPVPESTIVLKVTRKSAVTKKSGKKIQKSESYVFVVSSCMADGPVNDLATTSEGRRAGVLPCGGVAIQIDSGNYSGNLGGAFSYLPLNVCTGLPFHINGSFLLPPNRRHLWGKASSASEVKQGGEFETRWNVCFMKEVLSKALVNLLVDLQTLQVEDYLNCGDFQKRWPLIQHTESDFYPLVEAFYNIVGNTEQEQAPNVIYSGNRWVSIHDCFFVKDQLCTSAVGDAVKVVLTQYLSKKKWVHLDEKVLYSMKIATADGYYRNNLYDLERFLCEVFFPMVKNEEDIPRKIRNKIMLYLLDLRIGTEKRIKFDGELRNLNGIPVSPHGEELTSPEQLINPEKTIGHLYQEEDGKFPYGKEYRRNERLLSLTELGMASDNLKWDDICERAESFATDTSKKAQLEKSVILLDQIQKNLNNNVPTPKQTNRLKHAAFLPVLTKPKKYPMTWCKTHSLYMSASNLFEEKHKYLLGSVQPLLDENCLDADRLSQVKTFLGIGNLQPDVADVIKQLRAILEQVEPVLADTMCRDIYAFLNNIVFSNENQDFVDELKTEAFVLVEGQFLKCDQLAFKYERRGGHYLYAVPNSLMKYKNLLQACGVNEMFTFCDYVNVLEKLKKENDDQPLTDADRIVAEDMLKAMVQLAESEDLKRGILALDQKSILRPVSELIYNDMSWMDPIDKINYTHKNLTEHDAKKLGINTSRQQQLANCSTDHGFEIPFGQKEKLTTRLKGILREYSHKADVLKELLQNADDAGATEIHIVYDPRKDKGNKIVGPSWEPMHASPALCVFNNKPFTEADIYGIQQVGVGGKISDATTTGRFGIGFNSVYHLTDCPTFLTNKEKLCVFDPHEKYIPGASTTNPGKLYTLRGPDGCLATFPDMINGYLGEYNDFDLENGTMFRFPLRTSVNKFKVSVNKSEISDNTYNEEAIQTLLCEFERIAKESLLFLNSIQKISISEINPSTKLVKLRYQIVAKVPDEGIRYRKELLDHIQLIKQTSSGSSHNNWVYQMNIRDSKAKCETWLVSQSFGVDEVDDEQERIRPFGTKAHLPRGGVAALIDVHQTTSAETNFQRRFKAFTILPLSIYTGLPVHVNGTFELDQSRRNLVKGEDYGHEHADKDGFIHRWNKLLAVHVIGPAYAKLLQAAGRLLLNSTKQNIHDQIKLYDRLFPINLKDLRGEWALVAKATLLYIGNNLLSVLPVVRTSNTEKGLLTVTWHQPLWEKSKAFFDNLSDQQPAKESKSYLAHDSNRNLNCLQALLRKIGFHLLSSNPKICEAFQDAGVKVSYITPNSVLNHLSMVDCISNKYPCSVSDSAFQNAETLQIVLTYCLSKLPGQIGTENTIDLNGLPLCLTNDGKLNVFKSTNYVYITHHLNVLPCLPELFIHHDLVSILECWLQQDDVLNLSYCSGIFKEFTLYELSRHIKEQLPVEWEGCTEHMKWTPGTNGHPSQEWIRHLWQFILYRCSVTDIDEMQTLSQWPIYPTTNEKVVSPQLSKTILYPDNFSDTSCRPSLLLILQKIGCPRVNVRQMCCCEGDTLSCKACNTLSSILAKQLAVPTSQSNVLTVIRYMMNQEQFNKLTAEECDSLLRYFQEACENGEELSDIDIQTLKRLPVFLTAHSNRLTSIFSNTNCHTVNSCILPSYDVDELLAHSGCILLKVNSMLKLLYQRLHITTISMAGIFLKYILPNFHMLSQRSKLGFVEHIKDKILQQASDEEKKALYSRLEEIAFLPDIHGALQTADYFYDLTNEVFVSMIETRYLLPKEFNTSKWRPFLKHIGLQDEVNQDMFTKFAKQIADKATRIMNDKEQKCLFKQSRILVKQLECNQELQNSAFLTSIAKIKFIPSVPIDSSLTEIHPPLSGNQKCGITPFISFQGAVPERFKELAWSVAMILPSWAIPQEEYSSTNSVIDRVKVHQCLGIETKIIMDKVISHIQNVCQHMAIRNAVDRIDQVSTTVRTKLTTVVKGVLRYLISNLQKHEKHIKQRLQLTPICPVENGAILVTASQLVFEMDSTKEKYLQPHLFKAPRELRDYDNLLRALGAQTNMTFDQLAGVLRAVKNKCDDDKMDPNERRTVHTAIHCIFLLLHQTDGKCPISVTELYLPTPNDKLKRSIDLHYTDAYQMDRLALASTQLEFIVPLKQCGVKFVDNESLLIKLLPANLRPQNIQDLIQEKPCDTNKICPAEDHCPFLGHFKKMITSEEMQCVLLRLVQHQNDNHARPTNDQTKNIESLIKFNQFLCVLELKTGFYDKNGTLRIPRKESKPVFLRKNQDTGEFILYLEHQNQNQNKKHRMLFNSLARNINIICNSVLDKNQLSILREVVECKSIDDMNELLSSSDIPEYDPTVIINHVNLQKPGCPVPNDIHHLLDDDPYNLFREDEIVVYKRPVESGLLSCDGQAATSANVFQIEDVATDSNEEYYFVFAQILKQIPSTEKSHLRRQYSIDIGEDEPITVSVVMLYKFRRPRKATETAIAIFTGDIDAEVPKSQKDESPPENFEDAKHRIRDAVKDAFSLPKKEQDECIRRLYKMWHPDKNSQEQNLLYNEAFTFLIQELERLKKGNSTADSYSDRYDKWDSDIYREREQERNYQKKYSAYSQSNRAKSRSRKHNSSYGNSFVPPSFSTNAPDPRSARLWLRQAEEEFSKAKEQHQLGASWLSAFLLHQTVEKALKAVRFYQSGKADKNTNDLLSLVTDISSTARHDELTTNVSKLVGMRIDFMHPRYPDSTTFKTSMQRYADFSAEKALELCGKVLDIVRELVGIRLF